MVNSLVQQALKGTLNPKAYPSVQQQIVPCDRLILFIVGGATYEEARELSVNFNEAGNRVILGGTCMLNSE